MSLAFVLAQMDSIPANIPYLFRAANNQPRPFRIAWYGPAGPPFERSQSVDVIEVDVTTFRTDPDTGSRDPEEPVL